MHQVQYINIKLTIKTDDDIRLLKWLNAKTQNESRSSSSIVKQLIKDKLESEEENGKMK